MGIDADEQVMGRLLYLPVGSAAGETAALRRHAVDVLRQRRPTLVEQMSVAVRRSGLAPLLEIGGVAVERRLDEATRMVLAAWERRRPLRMEELDALRDLGTAVGRSGVPLWRLLNAVQCAAGAGWDYAVEQVLAVVEDGRRPHLAARLVAELSLETLELVGRIQAQIAAGHGEVAQAPRPPKA
jgi:hypothetical protein